jgi:hypothetical protein
MNDFGSRRGALCQWSEPGGTPVFWAPTTTAFKSNILSKDDLWNKHPTPGRRDASDDHSILSLNRTRVV